MTSLKVIENKIKKIKKELMGIDEMHPGSLSKQFNICGNPTCRCKDPVEPKKHGPYFQLSFVLNGKSTSRFIKDEHAEEVERHVANYQRFKALTTEWKELAAAATKMKLDAQKTKKG